MEYIYRKKVNYYEVDSMGVVHHSNYIRYFEEARCDMSEKMGMPYNIIEEKGFLMPVLDVQCKYIYPAKYGDNLVIKTKVKKFSGIRMIVEYEILNELDNNILVKGETSHCFTNEKLKPINMKKVNVEIYNKLNEKE